MLEACPTDSHQHLDRISQKPYYFPRQLFDVFFTLARHISLLQKLFSRGRLFEQPGIYFQSKY